MSLPPEVEGRAYNNFVSRNLKLEAVELSETEAMTIQKSQQNIF